MLSDPEGSYLKPNDGSSVTLLVTTRAPDGTVWQPETEVTFTTDDEQVGVGAHTHTHCWFYNTAALVLVCATPGQVISCRCSCVGVFYC